MVPFVILTGASGVGKTSVAEAVEALGTEVLVYRGDHIGFPSDEILASYGPIDKPGGPLQRGFALYWIGILAEQRKQGKTVLLETQCRIAFLREALQRHGVSEARILLLECSDASREMRLQKRGHPELANEEMSNWSRYLHAEAVEFGLEILNTTDTSLEASTAHILRYLRP